MSQLSDYLENAIINHFFRNSTVTAPAAVYVALHTADPTDGASGAELAGNGYAREALTLGAPTDGSAQNTAAVEFTASGGNWGTITHFSIWDAAAAGNMLAHASLDASQVVNDGGTLTFAIGGITLTLQ